MNYELRSSNNFSLNEAHKNKSFKCTIESMEKLENYRNLIRQLLNNHATLEDNNSDT